MAVRDGERGSVIWPLGSFDDNNDNLDDNDDQPWSVPAATLTQGLINPTGAGNAYAAAFTALRGTGSSVRQAACIATAVGAVFCECHHCPTWTMATVERIVHASRQVEERLQLRQ